MDREVFVQNIEKYCAQNGVKPTNACRDSGVGASFVTDITNRNPCLCAPAVYQNGDDCTGIPAYHAERAQSLPHQDRQALSLRLALQRRRLL